MTLGCLKMENIIVIFLNCKTYIFELIKEKCEKEKRDIKTFNFYKFEDRRVIRI